jgi:acyl carrier protein
MSRLGGRSRRTPLEVTQLAVVINYYISRKLIQDATLLPLANATPLQETGVLDSLSLLRRVLFVQERFGIVMDDVDLVPEHLASVDTLCAYLRSRTERTTRQGGGHG